MSPVTQKPIIHGRDHALGGADEIPGIGAGGGALEWADTGGTSPGVSGLENWRFVTFHSSSIVTPGGTPFMSWDASPVASYDPDSNIAARDGSVAHSIKLLSYGTYALLGEVHIGDSGGVSGGMTVDSVFALNGGVTTLGFGALGVARVWPGGGWASGSLIAFVQYSGSSVGNNFAVQAIWPPPVGAPIEMAFTVVRMV